MLLDVLAVHRLTRLITRDTITRPFRTDIIRGAYIDRAGPDSALALDEISEAEWDRMPEDDDNAPKLAAFVICPWCVGLWISGFVVVARRYAPVLWAPLARMLAFSTVAALLEGLDR